MRSAVVDSDKTQVIVMRLENRVAIVTGAAGGIGGAIARCFAREGANLCLVDAKPMAEVAGDIRAEDRLAIEVIADVSNPIEVREVVKKTLDSFGHVDVLVNAAGIASFGATETLSAAEWDRVLAVNLKSVFLMSQAVLPSMAGRKFGRIINIGSVVAKNGGNAQPWLNQADQDKAVNSAYGVAKAGVHAFTTFLAREVAASGITVNAVAPGPIAVARRAQGIPLPDSLLSRIPVGRIGRVEEVAEAVLYLAGEMAGFVTAEVIDVNGGLWGD